MFEQAILPLHKAKSMRYFHEPLTECVLGYLAKNEGALVITILTLLRYWPKVDPHKE